MDNSSDNPNEFTIKVGDYIVVQRQNYTKLHKLKRHGTLALGTFIIQLDSVVGCKYFDTFQMLLQPGSKRLYDLEKVDEVVSVRSLNIEKSGADNRNIADADDSQLLTKEDIDKLKEEDAGSSEIVSKLIANSKTFASKTEYSQEKYLKKKEKKYFEYVVIRKPTIRILAQMYYRQDPAKTLGIRMDDLSQILTQSNVQSTGDYLLYDSGTSGLVMAAVMNAIGVKGTGRLIHMHPGNECQKNAFVAMQFPEEQAKRCINVNVYSVLRCYYQNKESYEEKVREKENEERQAITENMNNIVDQIAEPECVNSEQNKRKLDDMNDSDKIEDGTSKKQKITENGAENTKKRPGWQYDNENACRILKNGIDGVIIVAKDHPVNIVKELQRFLRGNRNLVVFCLIKEPLQDLYVYLKTRCDYINIKLSSNFMRYYQVLPDRTHPEVNMNSGGFLLSAYKLAT